MFDFRISDNLIFTKSSIIAIFEIEPIDIFLISQEDRVIFFSKLYDLFNLLEDEIQFNVLIKKSSIQDFEDHFLSMLKSAEGDLYRECAVQSNIKDLKCLIEESNNNILSKNFYFEVKAKCNTRSIKDISKSVTELEHKFQRMHQSMLNANLKITQVVDKKLDKLIHSYY